MTCALSFLEQYHSSGYRLRVSWL